MKVSIIVPTLNEERLLPRLLESVGSQSRTDHEVIVADAGSTDATRSIAADFGAQVVEGGLPGVGRNAGARAASGEYLFFLDADVVLPEDFIAHAVHEMDDRFVDLATCEIRPLSDHALDRIVHKFINAGIRTSLRLDPKAMGFCIFVTKRLFNRVGGFDETIRLGEDAEFVKRAAKLRNLHWLNTVYIQVSVRRFEKEGRLQSVKKGIRLNLHRAFKGEVRDDAIEYQFAHYDSEPEETGDTLLEKVEQTLMRIETNPSGEGSDVTEQVADALSEATEDLKSIFKRRIRKREQVNRKRGAE